MGFCEKCDDGESGRLDYDLTSEKGRKTWWGAELEVEKGDRRIGKGEGRRRGQATRQEGKSDVGKGNEVGPDVRKIFRMNIKQGETERINTIRK